ncbi:hypothetical protein VTH82DRAFT_1360 [Thermothelomyces myriococcoides]
MPDPDENAPIRCQLFNYSLSDSGKGTHLYETLSYVWGSPEKPHYVSTDKGDLPITRNLYMALKRLRDHSLDRVIWADAICINQNDVEERSRQVQSMAKIYAKATRVVVWLEEEETGGNRAQDVADGGRALETLRVAAERQSAEAMAGEADQQAVFQLLRRSWFQRIWVRQPASDGPAEVVNGVIQVLQEVAAARQVLIVCHSAEIDGYTFCSGLTVSNPASYDPKIQSRFRSVAYLINGAIFRPKYVMSHQGRFSLGIRPLGQLIDMYHNRKATDLHDKVYALLGMTSDDYTPSGLLPDYTVPWQELFRRLVKSLVGEHASVETWGEDQIAIIQTKGWVLGCVSKVEDHATWADEQVVEVILKNIPESLRGKRRVRWTLHASAKPVRDGDIIRLLQGAASPTIVRPRTGHYAQGVDEEIARIVKLFDQEVLAAILDQHGGEVRITENVVKAAAANERGDTVLSLLLDRHGGEVKITEEVVEAAAQNCFCGKKLMALLLDRCGNEVKITERIVKAAVENQGQGKVVMGLLLDRRGDEVKITERVLKAAAENRKCGDEVMALLLNRRDDEIKITEEVMMAAAENKNSGKRVMAQLLKRRANEIKITERVVKAAVGNPRCGKKMLALLLDHRDDEVKITEEVVKAIARNRRYGLGVMELLLDRRGAGFEITEEILKAAARNEKGDKMMGLLLSHFGAEVRITEGVVKEAASNESTGHKTIELLHSVTNINATTDVIKAAATSGQEEVLRFFDQRSLMGSNNKESWFQIARFYNAAKTGDVATVRQLLKNSVPPDLQNIRGETPLWVASSQGQKAVVKLLLETAAVDINRRNEAGQTPLFWAAASGQRR